MVEDNGPHWRRRPFALMLAAAAASVAGCAPAARKADADLILVNGDMRTADSARPSACAFAVRDGRFVAVGTDAEMRALAGPETRVTDRSVNEACAPPIWPAIRSFVKQLHLSIEPRSEICAD